MHPQFQACTQYLLHFIVEVGEGGDCRRVRTQLQVLESKPVAWDIQCLGLEVLNAHTATSLLQPQGTHGMGQMRM